MATHSSVSVPTVLRTMRPSRSTRNVSGTPKTPHSTALSPSGSTTLGKSTPPNSSMNPWAASSLSIVSIPTTTRPRGPSWAAAAWSTGNSSRHGGHHEAHTLTSVTWPRWSARSKLPPSSVRPASGGAGSSISGDSTRDGSRPNPTASTTATTTATAAATVSHSQRRDRGAGSMALPSSSPGSAWSVTTPADGSLTIAPPPDRAHRGLHNDCRRPGGPPSNRWPAGHRRAHCHDAAGDPQPDHERSARYAHRGPPAVGFELGDRQAHVTGWPGLDRRGADRLRRRRVERQHRLVDAEGGVAPCQRDPGDDLHAARRSTPLDVDQTRAVAVERLEPTASAIDRRRSSGAVVGVVARSWTVVGA